MQSPHQRPSIGILVVRYGIGVVMVLAGVVLLIISPASLGVDGFAMAVGGGLSVLMINWLFRLGVSGDLEREREEEARRYFDEHGFWPDEAPQRQGRQWSMPPGVVTPEDEERERERARLGAGHEHAARPRALSEQRRAPRRP